MSLFRVYYPWMPRKSQRLEWLEPAGRFVVKVGLQNRLRVDSSLGQLVSWLPQVEGDAVDCLATVGAHGGLVLQPEEATRRYSAFMEELRARRITAEEASTRWINYIRFLAGSWPIHIAAERHKDSFRYNIHLPEGARTLGLLPSHPNPAVVFACQDLLEIWPGDAWVENGRKIAENARKERHAADEELAE